MKVAIWSLFSHPIGHLGTKNITRLTVKIIRMVIGQSLARAYNSFFESENHTSALNIFNH